MPFLLLLVAPVLAADPCLPGSPLVVDLDHVLSLTGPGSPFDAVVTDPLVGTPWEGMDLRIGVSEPALLGALVTAHFLESRVLDRTNVVTNNSTGRPVLRKGRRQYRTMTGVSEIREDESGILVLSQLQIDADGSADSRFVDPDHGQVDTSLRWRDGAGRLHSFDTFTVPFFVLPYHWYTDHGVEPGDVAAVLHGDRIEYAVFADVGPWQKLGEGSIALHDDLGNNPWTSSGRPWNGIEEDPGVTMVVFPGSRDEVFPVPEGGTRETFVVDGAPDVGRIREVGQQRLEEMLGTRVEVTPRMTPHTRPGG